MRSNYNPIGEYVKQVKAKNSDGSINTLQGVSIEKYYMPSVANINGVDLKKYKVVSPGQFAFNPMHVGRDKVLPISLLEGHDPIIVSPAYTVFEVISDELLPEYLMMWFCRPEFDRNAWFKTDGNVRGGLSWDDFCEIELLVTPLEDQKKIVNEYKTVLERKTVNLQKKKIIENLIETIFVKGFILDVNNSGRMLGDYVMPKKGRNITRAQMKQGDIPVIAGGITPSGYHNVSNTRNPVITISASGAGAGYVELHNKPVWSSDSSFIDYSCTKYVYFVYTFLKYHQAKIYSMQEGTGQPHIYPEHIASISFPDCTIDEINEFEEKVTPLYKIIANISNQNSTLEELLGLLNANMVNL